MPSRHAAVSRLGEPRLEGTLHGRPLRCSSGAGRLCRTISGRRVAVGSLETGPCLRIRPALASRGGRGALVFTGADGRVLMRYSPSFCILIRTRLPLVCPDWDATSAILPLEGHAKACPSPTAVPESTCTTSHVVKHTGTELQDMPSTTTADEKIITRGLLHRRYSAPDRLPSI